MSILQNYTQRQQDALAQIFELAMTCNDTGGGSTAARLLLGLYNGHRFPFALTDLRRLDHSNLEAALIVLLMDAYRFQAEVHVLIAALYGMEVRDVGAELEHWAYNYGLPGRCKKAQLPQRVKFQLVGA